MESVVLVVQRQILTADIFVFLRQLLVPSGEGRDLVAELLLLRSLVFEGLLQNFQLFLISD